jgi:YVTN family beta-propeller protein
VETGYVTNDVSVIDTATNTVEAATITVGTSPIAIAVTPATRMSIFRCLMASVLVTRGLTVEVWYVTFPRLAIPMIAKTKNMRRYGKDSWLRDLDSNQD